MKNIKDKLKQLISSGEDPELVRKLEEVLKEAEEEKVVEEDAEPVIALPTEIDLPSEAFEAVRKVAAERTRLEAILGQYYMKFELQMKEVTAKIKEKENESKSEFAKIITDFSPEGHAEEYILTSEPATSEAPERLFLKRKEDDVEEESL